MPRFKPDIILSAHIPSLNEKHRLELGLDLWGKRVRVRYNGRNSTKCFETTISDVFDRARRLVVSRVSRILKERMML